MSRPTSVTAAWSMLSMTIAASTFWKWMVRCTSLCLQILLVTKASNYRSDSDGGTVEPRLRARERDLQPQLHRGGQAAASKAEDQLQQQQEQDFDIVLNTILTI